MYEIKFEFRSVGLCGSFLFVSLFVPFFTSLPAYSSSLFTYLFLSLFFISSLFLVSFFLLFSIFLEPEPKLFHVTWVNKLHWHFIFYMVCNGKSKQHRPIRCSGVFWMFPAVFRGALGCSGVFQSVSVFLCSGVLGFSTCHSFNHFWQCVTKSCKVTIACQTN